MHVSNVETQIILQTNVHKQKITIIIIIIITIIIILIKIKVKVVKYVEKQDMVKMIIAQEKKLILKKIWVIKTFIMVDLHSKKGV